MAAKGLGHASRLSATQHLFSFPPHGEPHATRRAVEAREPHAERGEFDRLGGGGGLFAAGRLLYGG